MFGLHLQLGRASEGTTSLFLHVAVFPPRLVYPSLQLSVRVVPSCTGSAGSVTTLLHVESTVKQPGIETTTVNLWSEISGGGPSQLMSIKVKCHPLFSRI